MINPAAIGDAYAATMLLAKTMLPLTSQIQITIDKALFLKIVLHFFGTAGASGGEESTIKMEAVFIVPKIYTVTPSTMPGVIERTPS